MLLSTTHTASFGKPFLGNQAKWMWCAVSLGQASTLENLFQISLSTCIDSGRGFEVHEGALGVVSAISPVRQLYDLSISQAFIEYMKGSGIGTYRDVLYHLRHVCSTVLHTYY